jgi:hypothetical protein
MRKPQIDKVAEKIIERDKRMSMQPAVTNPLPAPSAGWRIIG